MTKALKENSEFRSKNIGLTSDKRRFVIFTKREMNAQVLLFLLFDGCRNNYGTKKRKKKRKILE